MVTSPFSPRAYSLLHQLQRQCRLGQQLLISCRQASSQTRPKPSQGVQAGSVSNNSNDRPQQAAYPELATPGKDDKEFVPQPLLRPLGITRPPEPGENSGIDSRTLRQRRNDLVNYDKHIERRKAMTKQISKPYYRDWKNLQYAKGKLWIAPERLFRAEKAHYFPNIQGVTLQTPHDIQDTTDQFADSISVVSLYSGQWALGQAQSFLKDNKELDALLDSGRAGKMPLQKIDINLEQNVLRSFLLRIFMGGIKRQTPAEDHERYFMVRRGVTDDLKKAFGMLNNSIGYTYLVDQECRIRWAACADAQPEEKVSLTRGAAKLVEEYRQTLGEKHWKDNGFEV